MRFQYILLASAMLTIGPAQGGSSTSPKADCEALLASIMPSVQKLLAEDGEFYPVGATMQTNGHVANTVFYEGKEHPRPQDVIDNLVAAFRAQTKLGKVRATAIVWDGRIDLGNGEGKSDAIFASLEHRDNYSVVVVYPYRRNDGNIVYGEILALQGEKRIF